MRIFLRYVFYVCGTCGAGAGASTAICHRDQGLRNDIEASEIEEKRKPSTQWKKIKFICRATRVLTALTKAYVVKLHPITINKFNVFSNRVHFHIFGVQSGSSSSSSIKCYFAGSCCIIVPLFHIILLLLLLYLCRRHCRHCRRLPRIKQKRIC